MNTPGLRARLSSWTDRTSLALVVVAVTVLLAWTALGKWEFHPLGPDYDDHYNLLVHGFRKGSLALDLPVPEALKRIEDPWNPANRPAGLALPPDTSYFNGHFYLYFGVVPAVTLMWPFRALTGMDLPMAYALIAFCVGAFWVLAWLWWRLLRDHFPEAGTITRVGGILVLGMAGGLLMLARRAHFWELPIAAGQFHLAVALAAAYLSLHARRPRCWLAVAGLALGLAVGSRPTLAVTGVGLAVLVVALGWRSHATEGWRGAWRKGAASALLAGAPLALVIAGLLAYNYARFGKFTEFGLNYQLTSRHESQVDHFSLGFAGFNWEMYFRRMPQWERYFPFVRPAATPLQPEGYYTCEYVFGALTLSPVIWFALLLPTWLTGEWRRRPGRGNSPLFAFGAILAVVTIAITGVLLCFNTAVARYTADFLPGWLLLGLLGWATAEWWLGQWRGWRWVARAVMGLLMLATALLAYCASVRLHGVMRYRNPAAYTALARIFNTPAAWWEAKSGQPWGPVEMDVTFPEDPPPVREPLVVAGVAVLDGQTLFVDYLRPGFIRLGFETPERFGPLLSGEIAVETGRSYHLRVEAGSLYPREGHPLAAHWTPEEIAWHAQWLRVELDGRAIFDGFQIPWEVSPADVRIGRDIREGREPRFTGVIRNVRRTGLPRALANTQGAGDVVLRLQFPANKLPPLSRPGVPPVEKEQAQPLVTAGRPGRADLVAIKPGDDGKTCTLLYESWGSGLVESPPIALPAGGAGTWRIRLGSILNLPPSSPLDALRDTLVVWLDDRPVWWRRLSAPIEKDPPLAVASNPIGSNSAAPVFSGRVSWWDRRPAPAAWRPGPCAGLRLRIIDRGSGAEPLLATGAAGAANTLAIEWLADGKARLQYDHWGHSALASEVFDWAAGSEHELEIGWPALPGLDVKRDPAGQDGRLRVVLDGRVLWDQTVPFYPADSASVVVGRNPAGSSIAGPVLGSMVLEIVQQPLPAGGAPGERPNSP